MKKTKEKTPKWVWIIVIVAVILLIIGIGPFIFLMFAKPLGDTISESAGKQVTETAQLMKCYGECIDAFRHSAISVGKEMINCIDFASGGTTEEFFLSKDCETFFQNKPKTVSECGG